MAMTPVTLTEAQQRLPELLAAAEAGELVEIRSETGRAVRLIPSPVRPRPPVTGVPKAGSCEGLFVVPDDFKESLDERGEYLEIMN
jgi:antitoxin (DNA-binding transcriptional repressor) of toxin-antitoxin stability system